MKSKNSKLKLKRETISKMSLSKVQGGVNASAPAITCVSCLATCTPNNCLTNATCQTIGKQID